METMSIHRRCHRLVRLVDLKDPALARDADAPDLSKPTLVNKPVVLRLSLRLSSG